MKQGEFIRALQEEMLFDSDIVLTLENGDKEYILRRENEYVYSDYAITAPSLDDGYRFNTFEEMIAEIEKKDDLLIVDLEIQHRNMRDNVSAEDFLAFYA